MHLSSLIAILTTLLINPLLLTANANANALTCLTDHDASTLATNFGLLVSNYTSLLANQTLAPDFLDYSESVNTLIDGGGTAPFALLNPTFSSRAQFEALSSQQPSVPFKTTNLWHTCDTVFVRWLSAQTPEPVVGISILRAEFVGWGGYGEDLPVPWLIKEIFGEFDSGAWLVNAGVFKPAAPPGRKGRRGVAF